MKSCTLAALLARVMAYVPIIVVRLSDSLSITLVKLEIFHTHGICTYQKLRIKFEDDMWKNMWNNKNG